MESLPESAASFLATLKSRARELRRTIVFPEGSDPRVITAAARLQQEGMAQPALITSTPQAGLRCIDPANSELLRKYAAIYYERRRAKGVTEVEAAAVARKPLYFGALMAAAGDAHGCVAGAANTTSDVVRAALHCVGAATGVRLVSSAFIMALRDRAFGHNGLLTFADCAIVVHPCAVELAQIAMAAAETTRQFLRTEPVVALLSFSTKGSASHAHVDEVVEALKILRQRAPDLNVDGELQADAALIAAIGQSKAPGSTVAGRANTLIFPNLAAGNIAYKLVERLADAVAIGPVLQGLAKPINDVSRGSSAEHIYHTAIITACQG